MDNSFVNKLRMNNLYPTMPGPPGADDENYPLFNTFMNRIAPMMGNRIGDIGERARGQMQNPPITNLQGPNVVYRPPASDAIATSMLGKNLGLEEPPITPFQKASLGVERQKIESMAGDRQTELALRKQELERRTTEGKSKIEQGTERIQIEQGKQKLIEWKAKNPNGKIIIPKGGNVTIINPQTGEATDTGIDYGSLTDTERINLTGEKAKEIKQTSPARVEELPTQQKTDLQLKANKAITEHPEWASHMEQDPNTGMIHITPPSPGFMRIGVGPSKEEYDKMYNYIYGSSEIKPPAGKETGGKIKMTTPDGKGFRMVSPEHVKLATQQGFKKIQ